MNAPKVEHVINAMGDGLVLFSMDGKIVSVNPAFEKMSGYKKRELVGKKADVVARKMLKPEYMPRAKKEITATIKKKIISTKTYNLTTKNGREIPIVCTSSFIKDTKGKPIYMVIVVKDITEFKRVEETLRETNKKLQTLINAIPDPIYFKDTRGRNLVVNKALEGLVGLKREKIVGKTDDKFLPPDLAKYCRQSDKKVMKSRRPLRFTEKSTSKDGKKISFDTIKVPLFDDRGNIVGLVGVSRDITQLKRLQEKEREARAKAYLESGLASIPEGVVIFDKEGKFIYVNSASLKRLGRKEKDFIGKTILEISPSITTPKTTKIILEKTKMHLKIGRPITGAEIELIDKDGKSFPVSYSAAIFRDEKGNAVGTIAFIEDITERKRAEEERKRLTRQLVVVSGTVAAAVKKMTGAYRARVEELEKLVMELNAKLEKKQD